MPRVAYKLVGTVIGDVFAIAAVDRYSLRCRCKCGAEFTALASNIATGATRSCGCARRETNPLRTHGMSKHSLYKRWLGMKKRCESPRDTFYPQYGGRGIKVCERWQWFPHFVADMGPQPSPDHSVDRINPDGDYSPENCRWATWSEQAANKRPKPPSAVCVNNHPPAWHRQPSGKRVCVTCRREIKRRFRERHANP